MVRNWLSNPIELFLIIMDFRFKMITPCLLLFRFKIVTVFVYAFVEELIISIICSGTFFIDSTCQTDLGHAAYETTARSKRTHIADHLQAKQIFMERSLSLGRMYALCSGTSRNIFCKKNVLRAILFDKIGQYIRIIRGNV